MLEVTVNRIGTTSSSTIAIIHIDDENMRAKPEFPNPPDAKTAKLIRKALDALDAEAAKV
jgi:hypothetical protein